MDSRTNKKLMSFPKLCSYSFSIFNGNEKSYVMSVVFLYAMFFWLTPISANNSFWRTVENLMPIMGYILFFLFRIALINSMKCSFQNKKLIFKKEMDLVKRRAIPLFICDVAFVFFSLKLSQYVPRNGLITTIIDFYYLESMPLSLIMWFTFTYIFFVWEFINYHVIFSGVNIESFKQIVILIKNYGLKILSNFLFALLTNIIIVCIHVVGLIFPLMVALLIILAPVLIIWNITFPAVMLLNLYDLKNNDENQTHSENLENTETTNAN